MNKDEFKIYISTNNIGNYKKRKSHIKNIAPNILLEIEYHIKKFDITPFNFSDALFYYLNDITVQNKCLVCGANIYSNSQYCNNKCKNKDIKTVLNKSRNTLLVKYGKDSPLKIKQFKEKYKNTCIENFGCEHSSSNSIVRDKIQQSNIKTYTENPEIRKNIGKKISNAYKNSGDEIIKKRRESNFKKTGEYKTLTSISIENAKKTLQEKYNTSNPFNIHKNTKELAKLGLIEFYKDPNKKKELIRKRINTIIKRYGSIEEMNKLVFNNRKQKTIDNLISIGLSDQIIKYEYSNIGKITCLCNNCKEEYDISLKLLRDRLIKGMITCTKCLPPVRWRSEAEIELYNWISQFIECESNNKKILKGEELDINIPDKNIAIEFNGIYWHSDLFKHKNYHLNKTLLLKSKNINLIHIWEDQWYNKKEIIKNRILSKLNINQISIGARKCKIKEISSKEANDFYEMYHLQGKTLGFKHIGLIHNNELISCLSIGKRKLGKNKNSFYEILRFCTKSGIKCIGAFPKLFKYAIENYPNNYVSYADLCWGEGNIYATAGFTLKEYSKPNYWYFLENKRYHRYTFNKQKLIKMGYDESKTEFQIMDEMGALRVYDSGNAVWEYRYIK